MGSKLASSAHARGEAFSAPEAAKWRRRLRRMWELTFAEVEELEAEAREIAGRLEAGCAKGRDLRWRAWAKGGGAGRRKGPPTPSAERRRAGQPTRMATTGLQVSRPPSTFCWRSTRTSGGTARSSRWTLTRLCQRLTWRG
eukprot:5194968-Pyramimonas_sp.AAC.1